MREISSFIPSDEVRKLTVGSFEDLRSRVEESVISDRARLFGSDAPVKVLGTFTGYALVLSEDSKIFRVRYETAGSGEISPIAAEVVPVQPVTESAFVAKGARAYVDSFLSGASKEAFAHLRSLLPHLSAVTAPVKPTIAESFQVRVNAPAGWKQLLSERNAQVQKIVGTLAEARLQPKFARLYDGSTPATELPNYAGLVTSDLKYAMGRLEGVFDGAKKAFESYQRVSFEKPELRNDDAVKVFERFAADFLADAVETKKALSEASASVNEVDLLAKIYDGLAGELYRFEMAGKFVEKMSCRLAEAITEEG